MSRKIFQQDVNKAFYGVNYHKTIDRILRILTFGILNDKNNVTKYEEKYNKAKSDLEKYNLLLSKVTKLDQEDETLEIQGVRISKHTFSDLPVVGAEDYGLNWDLIRDRILSRDSYECQESDGYCKGPLQIHHIIPLSKGGANELDNLITLCFYHHSLKHEHMKGLSHGNIRC